MKKVFVSGCYDVLHGGHLEFFRQAKALGDYLIVCLPSDSALFLHKRRLPWIPLDHKIHVIGALEPVDEVVVGEDMEPGLNFKTQFLRIRPQVLAVTDDDKYESPKRELCAKIGATGVRVLGQTAQTAHRLDKLPVYECPREGIWDFIGFKHVHGSQDWDSIAKAQYVARVHNDFRVGLEEIANKIGDQHNTVRRLYRGLMVLEQAERKSVFRRDDCWAKRFAFSHLWTGLGLAGIQGFIGLRANKGFGPDPVPASHLAQLGELCAWLYGSRKGRRRPVIRSQNPDLRNLDEVLSSKKGVAGLRQDLPLEICLKLTRGDERLLREALVVAEQALREAKGYIPTGYSGDVEMLHTARAVRIIFSDRAAREFILRPNRRRALVQKIKHASASVEIFWPIII